MKIPLGEWLPDQPALDNPGCIEAKNVIPRADSYSSLPAPLPFTNALTNACLGSVWLPDLAGNAVNFAGDKQRLYKLGTTSAWADVSRTASYSIASSWSFEKYGTLAIAADAANAVQYYDMSSGASTSFQNLGGSPPPAKYVATVRDFLVLANLASYRNRVHWSGFNNPELWTPSLATQCDYQDLPGRGGDIQGIVPGEYGVIFQESSIWRMDYAGPPTIFNFDEVERGKGAVAACSICWYGPLVFYYDWSGFQVFNGQSSQPIGHEKVDQWFEANCGNVLSLQGVVDRVNRIVMWGFKSSLAQPYNDRIIMYNFGVGKWSWGEVTTQYLAERRAPALTLDQLDTPLPLGIDLNSIPMDAKAFSADLAIQAFNASNIACTFEGSAMAATVETKELGFDESYADTHAVLPLVDGSSPAVTVRFAQRPTQARATTYSSPTGLNRIGEACRVQTSRFQRWELTITGGFDFVRGVDVRTRKAGRR